MPIWEASPLAARRSSRRTYENNTRCGPTGTVAPSIRSALSTVVAAPAVLLLTATAPCALTTPKSQVAPSTVFLALPATSAARQGVGVLVRHAHIQRPAGIGGRRAGVAPCRRVARHFAEAVRQFAGKAAAHGRAVGDAVIDPADVAGREDIAHPARKTKVKRVQRAQAAIDESVLAAQPQRARRAGEADESLAPEQQAALGRSARVGQDARIHRKDRRHAAAQVFAALETQPRTVGDAAGQLEHPAAGTAALGHHAQVRDAVHGHVRLRRAQAAAGAARR